MSRCVCVLAVGLLMTVATGAQAPSSLKTGNPTPGTPQPDPPALADRITLSGCVRAASDQTAGRGESADPNAPSDKRFVLTNAERLAAAPPDTVSSNATAAPASRTYRLKAIDSQLLAFVGTKVEISGEVLAAASQGESANAPTLQVEFVQKVAAACKE